MGVETGDSDTMTLFDNDLIYEFHDDHTNVTNLFNYTQPLIRYQMSDTLRPVSEPAAASPYLSVHSLVGRTETIPSFVNRDGTRDFIHPISIVELFIPGVTRFQMRLVNYTSFRFVIVMDSGQNEGQRNDTIKSTQRRLRALLEQKRMNNVTFDVVVVDDIPIDPITGKFRLIVGAPQGRFPENPLKQK
jgi:phenylacetate-coenzyme A ligase PaaK-like adenylate-forming protein